MELIDREEVIQARPVWRNEEVKYETEEATIKAREFSRGWNDCLHEYIKNINALPSAFEGMTYGEVMKAVLGIKDEQIEEAKYLICIYPKGNHHDPFMAVKREVWNSPYKEMSVIFGTVGASE